MPEPEPRPDVFVPHALLSDVGSIVAIKLDADEARMDAYFRLKGDYPDHDVYVVSDYYQEFVALEAIRHNRKRRPQE